MATKFGIRNYVRTGNNVTFTLVALNANGSIDTGFIGQVTWQAAFVTSPGTYNFVAGDAGARSFTITVTNPAQNAVLLADFPGVASNGAILAIASSAGNNVSSPYNGDNMLVGGTGNDTYSGATGDDFFRLNNGGNDSVEGRDGNDGFYFGGAYTASDVVNGGGGTRDQVGLQGDYSAGVTLGSLIGVEQIVLLPGNDTRFGDTLNNLYDYNITANSGTIVSDNKLTIQATTLRAGEDFAFNGAASGIDFLIYAGFGANVLTGGSGNDGFFFGQNRFTSNDYLTGGGGTDQLGLQGDYTGGNAISFGPSQLVGIETIVLMSASDNRFGASGGTVGYELTMNNDTVDLGQVLVISANNLQFGESLIFNGTGETNGAFHIYAGGGFDQLFGSSGNDIIYGGGASDTFFAGRGADTLHGGSGDDRFAYSFTTDSPSNGRDRILDFTLGDVIDFGSLVAFLGGGNLTFIGGNAQSGARQLQVMQTGDQATVNLYLDADANADLVIDVTVADGRTLAIRDFNGVRAMQQPADAVESFSPDARAMIVENYAIDGFVRSLDAAFIDPVSGIYDVAPTSDLLL